MTAVGAIQAVNPAEAWQALLQAAVTEAEPLAAAAPDALAEEAAPLAQPLPAAAEARPADPATRLSFAHGEVASVLQPLAPVLLPSLSLQQGPELRWRAAEAQAWRQLFEDAGGEEQDEAVVDDLPLLPDAGDEPVPDWALALLARLREAAAAPLSAAAMRPALQAWRLGLPVLVASPVGLASLQPSRDAARWCWRRWPVRWRSARPAPVERWWAVRLGLGAQGRPRTLRELAGCAVRLGPGQVSCELRLDDVAPGIAQWAEVLVQAPASASLRTLLGVRPSLVWLLCSQDLWPPETR